LGFSQSKRASGALFPNYKISAKLISSTYKLLINPVFRNKFGKLTTVFESLKKFIFKDQSLCPPVIFLLKSAKKIRNPSLNIFSNNARRVVIVFQN